MAHFETFSVGRVVGDTLVLCGVTTSTGAPSRVVKHRKRLVLHFLVFIDLEAAVPAVTIHTFSCVHHVCHSKKTKAIRTIPPAPSNSRFSLGSPLTDHRQTTPGDGDMVRVLLREIEAECSPYKHVIYCVGLKYATR